MWNRRRFIVGAAGATTLAAAGCAAPRARRAAQPVAPAVKVPPKMIPPSQQVLAMYAAVPEERFALPEVDIQKIREKFWRTRTPFVTRHPPGTILVDTKSFHLHLVEPGGTAMRYGVSLGKAGFEWSGRGVIQWKRPWPTWTPPDSMIARNPELEQWSARNGGMPPGLDNPLGARALYIYQGGRDTLYRVHGTPDPKSIGRAVSSGCVRMINQDVIDLYERVRPGARIIVV